jgi:invasion protein IalB
LTDKLIADELETAVLDRAENSKGRRCSSRDLEIEDWRTQSLVLPTTMELARGVAAIIAVGGTRIVEIAYKNCDRQRGYCTRCTDTDLARLVI